MALDDARLPKHHRRWRRGGVFVLVVSLAAAAGAACGSFGEAPSPDQEAGADGASSDGPSTTDGPDETTTIDIDAGSVVPPPTDGGRLVWVRSAIGDSDEVAAQGVSADDRCTTELSRPAFAWMTVNGIAPLARHPGAEGPWVDRAGVLVAATRTALVSGTLASGIHLTLNNANATGEVWTGVKADGTAGADCSAWNAQGPSTGIVGTLNATDGSWTNARTITCTGRRAFICFEK